MLLCMAIYLSIYKCKYIFVICSHTGYYTEHFVDLSGHLGDFMETRMHQQNETMDMPDLERS